MRYTEIETIPKVESFATCPILIYFSEGYISIGSTLKQAWPLNDEIRCDKILCREDKIYLRLGNGQLYSCEIDGSSTSLITEESGLKIFEGPFVHCTYYDPHSFTQSFNLLDIAKGSMVFEKNLKGRVSICNGTIFQYNEEIIAWYFENGDLFRTKKIESGCPPEKLLGVAHNHLFVLTKDNHISVLNVDDGSLIKTFEWTEPVEGTTYLPGLSEVFLNPEDQFIYCLGNYLIKIDTGNFEILICRHVSTSFDAMAGITVKNSSHQGRYISFTGWRDEYAGRGRVIGLFDIQSEEFVWIEELSQFIPAFQTPQLCGDKLYILDIENTLHIFERSDDPV